MSFTEESGYLPSTIEELMEIVRANVNAQFGTSFVKENFIGTNFYKFFYAVIQELQANEVRTAEIFQKMQEYFFVTNEMIQRPNTTHPGIFDYFGSKGYFVSTKPPIDADAGKLYICVDLDSGDPNYAAIKLAVNQLVKDCAVGGVVTQGTEASTIVLANGQSMVFKYNLPDEVPVKLRLTVTQSENNLFTVGAPSDVAQKLYDNIVAKYRLGKNFEPQRYFSVIDAPWAESVLLEYSLDAGATWSSDVYDSDYDEVFTFELADISVVED